jgi:hypothetical protein
MKKKILLLMSLFLIGHLSIFASLGDKYEAEDYDENSGAKAETNESLSGTGNVGYVKNGTWIKFSNVSFDGEETRIAIAAAGSSGGNVEFRLGAPDGTLIGTAVIAGTEGWDDYQIFSADIATVTGDNDLYLIFTGGDDYLFNVDYFILSGDVTEFTLTTSVEPEGAGEIGRNLDGPDYAQGTIVSIMAQKNLGYEFSHWEDANGNSVSEESELEFKMEQDTALVAVFDEVEIFSLVASVDTGAFVILPVPDTLNGQLMFNKGTSVNIIAAPAFGYDFQHWEDGSGNQVSTNSSYDFEINSNISLLAVVDEITEYALPKWFFDYEYYSSTGEVVNYYTPTTVAVSNMFSDVSAWIYSDNATLGNELGLTANAGEFTANDVRGAISARITWSGTTTLSDVTDADQHEQYYQFQFPTTGFENIEVSFTFSGGQNSAGDYLALAYSLNGGESWIDGGTYNAGEHWSNFNNYTTTLSGAEDKELVIVRLIGVVSNDGSNNFNLDEFLVNGIETGVPEEGLFAYYSFDDNVEDGSGNGYDGTTLGNPEFIEGRAGKALNFKGPESGDAVSTGIHFTPEGSFSIALWFKVNVWDAKFGNVLIGDRGDGNAAGNNNGFQIRQFAESEGEHGWVCFTTRGVASDKDFDPRKGLNSEEIAYYSDMPYMRGIYPGQWKHMVAVFDKDLGKKKIYINGNLVVDGTVVEHDEHTGYLPAAAYDQILIGARNDNDSTSVEAETSFNGAIDEVRIYTIAINDDKVKQLYDSYGDDLTGIDAFWKFDGTSDELMTDEVGNSHGAVVEGVKHIEGHSGTAITFEGLTDTSYVMVEDNEFVNKDTSSFSVSAIVKFDASANAGNEYQVLFKGGTGHETITAKGGDETWETIGKWFTMAFKGGELRFAIDDDVNKTQLGVEATELFKGDEWVHIMGVRDMAEDSVKLYVNGTLIGAMEDVTDSTITTTGIPLIIGNNKDQNLAFPGGIDELKIYGRALAAHEVEDIAFDYGLGQLPLKDNANITGISVNGVDVQPFMSIMKDYEVTLPEGTTEIIVEVFGADEDANVEITTTEEQSVIVVTAQDGVTTNTFTITYSYETGVEDKIADQVKAYFINKNELSVNGAFAIKKVELFDITGQLLMVKNVNASDVILNISRYSDTRFFILCVTNENNLKEVLKIYK